MFCVNNPVFGAFNISLRTVLLTAILFVLSIFTFPANAQPANLFYIKGKASVVTHPNASVNIFCDATNAGIFTSYKTSLITFFSRTWQNENGSRMPDESASGLDSIGGIFRFSGIYGNAQRIITINALPYNGFPNIAIDNVQNVTAETGNLSINNNLDFINGHLILNNVDVIVGRSGTGSITGYNENAFVVTGTGITGGHLVRSVTGTQGAIAFPLGTSPGSYTPASIIYTGNNQNLKLRVADNVYNKLGFPEYVYKTWVLATEFSDPSASADLTLQHNSIDEGTDYFRNRQQGYITRYNANLTGLWDVLPPSASTSPGTITTGTSIFNAYMNTRTGIKSLGLLEYFSKSTIKKEIDQNTPAYIPDAISPNGDGLNDAYTIVKRQPTDKVRLEVYSRNQTLVFRDNDYQNTFDGNGNVGGFLGNRLPDGVYYYLISVNNAKGIAGYLTINR